MKSYLIEPKASLVFRSGKPFGTATSADGATLPLPSSIAGVFRTTYAEAAGLDYNNPDHINGLKNITIKGPLFVKQHAGQVTLMVSKPADAIYMKHPNGNEVELHQLRPQYPEVGCGSDLPEGLLHVTLRSEVKGKPSAGVRFWSIDTLRQFSTEAITYSQVQRIGIDLPSVNTETHVSIHRGTGASDPGRLFQLASLDFQAKKTNSMHGVSPDVWSDQLFGMAAMVDVELKATGVALGGEHRLSRMVPLGDETTLYSVQSQVFEDCLRDGGIKMTLITPALFEQGFRPKTVEGCWTPLAAFPSFKLRLRAAAIERFVPVSGWDLQRNKPKMTRKACPAGSVFWFAIDSGASTEALRALDFSNISDSSQDRHDGFGLAVIAPWKTL